MFNSINNMISDFDREMQEHPIRSANKISTWLFAGISASSLSYGVKQLKESHLIPCAQYCLKKILQRPTQAPPPLRIKKIISGSFFLYLGCAAYFESLRCYRRGWGWEKKAPNEQNVISNEIMPPAFTRAPLTFIQDLCPETPDVPCAGKVEECPSYIERMKCLQKEVDKRGYSAPVCLHPNRVKIPNTFNETAAQHFLAQYDDVEDQKVIQKAFDSLILPSQEQFEEKVKKGVEELNAYLKERKYPPYAIIAQTAGISLTAQKSFDYVKDLAFRHLAVLPDAILRIPQMPSSLMGSPLKALPKEIKHLVVLDDAAYSCEQMGTLLLRLLKEYQTVTRNVFVMLPYVPQERCFDRHGFSNHIFSSTTQVVPQADSIFNPYEMRRFTQIMQGLGDIDTELFEGRTFLRLPFKNGDSYSFSKLLYMPPLRPHPKIPSFQTHCFETDETPRCQTLQSVHPPYKEKGYCLSQEQKAAT